VRKILICGLMAVGLLAEESFTVEKLSKCEMEDLVKVRKDLEKAVTRFNEVEQKIKQAHGVDVLASRWTANANCISTYTMVELKGEYALVTKKSNNLCGGDITLYNGSTTLYSGPR
jgi:hypothetical protein